jgi:hypothetical protein
MTMLIHPWKASTLVLASALAFTLASTEVPDAQADNQPRMYAALQQLQAAANQLDKAAHDKAGHRAAALKLTREAIAEVKKGIAADDAH